MFSQLQEDRLFIGVPFNINVNIVFCLAPVILRHDFAGQSTLATTGLASGGVGPRPRRGRGDTQRVLVLGIDAKELANLAALAA